MGQLVYLLVLDLILLSPIVASSSLTSSQVLSSQGTVTYQSQSTTTLHWRADFEEGTFYDITDAGYGYGGMIDDHPELGQTCQIVTSPVSYGRYAMKAALETSSGDTWSPDAGRAQAHRWVPMQDMAEAYFGVAFYIPSGFRVPYDGSSWALLTQLKESPGTTGSGILVSVDLWEGAQGVLRLELVQSKGEWRELWIDTQPAPTGQWFTIVLYLKATTDGQVKLWVNGVLKATVNGDFRSTSPIHVGPLFSAGLYGHFPDPTYVLFDEMRCASTYEAAVPGA